MSKYPHTEEEITEQFEKNILSHKERFLNSEKRISAMHALLIGAFVLGKSTVIGKVIRFLSC